MHDYVTVRVDGKIRRNKFDTIFENSRGVMRVDGLCVILRLCFGIIMEDTSVEHHLGIYTHTYGGRDVNACRVSGSQA